MAETPHIPQELKRYLTPAERVVLVQRRHWVALAEPVGTAAGSLFVLGWLSTQLAEFDGVTNVLVITWLVLAGRAAWKVWDWRRDLFIATSARLINIYGIVTRKVAMMPLAKVTDMSYIRSPWGKILRYGTFRLESAGQEQALGTIRYVVNPDETYRTITAEIFKPPSRRATDVRPTRGGGSALPVDDPDDAWWRR